MSEMSHHIDQLCKASEKQFINPFSRLRWPERIGDDQWCMSPELTSVFHTSAWQQLTELQKKRLSFYEAVNFFTLNIQGEKYLVEKLAKKLFQQEYSVITPYLHHFIDEENKHMMLFGKFCQRYAGKTYPMYQLEFSRDYEPGEEELLFFLKAFIFENIVDAYNAIQGRDPRLAEIVADINRIHHQEEARHLSFGKKLVLELFEEHSPRWPAKTLSGVREHLHNYIAAIWRQYYNPLVYRDAGLSDPKAVQDEALSHPANHLHRTRMTEKVVHFLLNHNILLEEPRL